MRSLRARILLTASLVLVTFLGAAGLLLDRAFQDTARDAVEDRLRGRVFMLLGIADFDAPGLADSLAALPDPALMTPGSGHYARISTESNDGSWESPSMLGLPVGARETARTGQWRMRKVSTSSDGDLFALSYGILWEGEGKQAPRTFTIEAYESDALFAATVGRFRRNLWSWFVGLSVVLLFVQAINLNRGLRPLAAVGNEVRAVEHGELEQLGEDYPNELTPLTRNINRLLKHNRDSVQRYRNALGDLAHAIKTPLAILRNEFEQSRPAAPPAEAVLDQLSRIDNTVQYHLQRAAAAGRPVMTPPRQVAPVIDRIVASLEKVYAERELTIENETEPFVVFVGDEGDLMEIVGNLVDNACKWAHDRVIVAASNPRDEAQKARFALEIRDDGPGIDPHEVERLTERGVRLDESVEGQGIGLAVVRDIVEGAYDGRLSIDSSPHGTTVRVELALP